MSSRQYIDRADHIGVVLVATIDAPEHGLTRPVLCVHTTTRRTRPARVVRRHGDEHPTRPLELVFAGEQFERRVQPHDSQKELPERTAQALGRLALVAILLRGQLRWCAYRRYPAVHRAAANTSLSAAKDACGVRAILTRPEGRGMPRFLIKFELSVFPVVVQSFPA
jgi:hypothetical protein